MGGQVIKGRSADAGNLSYDEVVAELGKKEELFASMIDSNAEVTDQALQRVRADIMRLGRYVNQLAIKEGKPMLYWVKEAQERARKEKR